MYVCTIIVIIIIIIEILFYCILYFRNIEYNIMCPKRRLFVIP